MSSSSGPAHRTKLSSPNSSTANLHSNSNMNYSLNMLNEIKKFNQNAQQLNILLDETNNACKELKVLQQTSLSGWCPAELAKLLFAFCQLPVLTCFSVAWLGGGR